MQFFTYALRASKISLLIKLIMNKYKFASLSCSSSLAFMLLTSTAANAGTITPQDLADVEFRGPGVEFVAQEDPQHPLQDALDARSDRIGDLAVAKFGCDCAGCRNQVIEMVQTW